MQVVAKNELNRAGSQKEENADDIMRLISNTNLETLYLNKNTITDFKECLRILSRTELIKNNPDDINIKTQSSLLINLNLSDNNCFSKNKRHNSGVIIVSFS